MAQNKKIIYAGDLLDAIRDDMSIRPPSFGAIVRHINLAPAVDAVEVVHGRWDTIWWGTDSRGNVVKCSVCGYKKFDTTDHYCPNCGAKMDGGAEHGKL